MKQNTLVMLILMVVLIVIGLAVIEMRRTEQANQVERMRIQPSPTRPSS